MSGTVELHHTYEGTSSIIFIPEYGGLVYKIYEGGSIDSFPKGHLDVIGAIKIAEFSTEDFVESCVKGYMQGEGKTIHDYDDPIPF